MKKKNNKNIAFIIAIILLIVVAIGYILNNKLTVTDKFQTSNELNTNLMGAAKIKSITNWKDRINSYASRLGRYANGKEEQKWLWKDTKNEYKDLYCVQSGSSHSTSYDVYDLYNISEAQVTKYFGDEAHYKHFMWILENMYQSNISDSKQKEYMETQLLNKLGTNAKTQYDAMPSELNEFYKRAEVTPNGNNITFNLYKYNSSAGKSLKTTNTVTLNGRENFIRTIQNYVLLHHVKQNNKDGNFGASPLNGNGDITLDLRTYKDDGSTISENIVNDTNSKKFAHALIKYLEEGYDSKSYNINKYKNFSDSYDGNVKIDKSKAAYDSKNYRIGPFSITNKYGFDVNIKVKIGDTDLKNYKIVDANGKEINLSSSSTSSKNFYVKFDNDIRTGTSDQQLRVDYSVDYGDVPTATLFVPTGSGDKPQTLINISRKHIVKNGKWVETVEGVKPDIALKKYITQINGVDVEKRLERIDTSTISNNNNATYYMNKTPISLNVGDTVTYVIQLFNEGNIDGTASMITDYLPNGLEVKRVYGDNKDAEYYLVYEYVSDRAINITNPYETKIKAFNGENGTEFEAKSQKIYVECKVVERYSGIYTNIAEISEYDLATGEDIDSSAVNWKLPSGRFTEYQNSFMRDYITDRNSDEWKDYCNNQSSLLDGGTHAFVGQEDDDDFEKIKVNSFDLALTKSIAWKYDENGEKVPLTTEKGEKTKLDIEGKADIIKGTAHDLKYNMNKDAAGVAIGDKVVSRIRVYNEGLVDGIVKEITDYMPEGLRFLEQETINENTNKYNYTYDEDKNILKIGINGETGVTIAGLTEENELSPIEINIVCEVTDKANGILFNSAAITQYGYMNGTDYIAADKENVDIDSYQTISSSMELKNSHKSKWNNKNAEELSNIYKSELHVQDDDDVDCVKVEYKPLFDLALRKNIYKVERKLRSKSIFSCRL